MKYIQLTKFDGNPLYINVEHITAVTVRQSFDNKAANTVICTLDGDIGWNVKESVSEVMSMIDDANR